VLPILAAILGLVASFLSGSRGGWIALPGLATVLIWHAWHRIARWQVTAATFAFVALAITAYAVPQTGVRDRIAEAQFEIENYFATGEANTSVGARLEMWRTAWMIFREHPWLGVGMGGYAREKADLIEQGIVDPAITQFNHPHNEYLAALATRGVVGFASLLLLFGIGLKVFYERYRNPRLDPAFGLAGLVVVVAFVHFSFSGDTFDRSMPISFITFMLAVLSASPTRATTERAKRAATLSVIVIAKNEADRIEPCLQSVSGWADEIIVLDSESTDATAEIARRYTSHVEVTDWPGFGPQKQRALDRATGDWVLSIDADERVTPELREEIDLLLSATPRHVAYRIPWQVMSFGKTIDFGRSGRAPLRLFKREGARFTAAQVHEHVVTAPGTIGRTYGRLIHDSHRSLAHALEKFDKYAWLWATERAKRGKRDNPVNAALHAGWMFFGIYVLRLGMLDGKRGLMMATLFAQYTFNKHAALWTLQRGNGTSS
jgi:(heptosyl)LPS beta-1,4-glucosyltransferase